MEWEGPSRDRGGGWDRLSTKGEEKLHGEHCFRIVILNVFKISTACIGQHLLKTL